MSNKAMSVSSLQKMKAAGERFAVLTAYDATFASLLDECGVEVILVGDSLGMVVQGGTTTLPVTVDDIVYHTRAVSRGSKHALIMADMPFMADATPQQAVQNAGRLMKEGGAHMVKLEGGASQVEVVRRLSELGIPVCGHLGLQPQSVHKLGGYKVQGRDEAAAESILNDSRKLVEAGADMLLLECVPAALAAQVTNAVTVPVIGIGAGAQTDAQVLVLYDMLGITPGHRPKFTHDFMTGNGSIAEAIRAYVSAVKSGQFPAEQHCFH
ncbi:MAG: 3-methyl-2-oxobutanoate hydroxymethyltransferase [Gammaproteobacteria bacterium]|nr:3-methyl-2-oxobutanoate hydroxymethyltransferase [Gammaproteobacteria bacterium]